MSFTDRILKRKNKNEATIEATINRQHIVDAVGQFLVATTVVPKNRAVTNIQFSDLFGVSGAELCKIKIYTQKEVPV